MLGDGVILGPGAANIFRTGPSHHQGRLADVAGFGVDGDRHGLEVHPDEGTADIQSGGGFRP